MQYRSPEQRKEFYSLANTHDELPPALGIFSTNAISVGISESGALFPTLSRFNSACRPNLTRPAWDPTTRSTRLYANHAIAPGEELCWPYLGVPFEFDGIEERRGEIQRVFGFECGCEACEQWGVSEKGKKESEERLSELRRLKGAMGGEREGRAGVIKEMERLARIERLYVQPLPTKAKRGRS